MQTQQKKRRAILDPGIAEKPVRRRAGKLLKKLRSVLAPKTYGAVCYRCYPTSGRMYGPFNGQRGRCLLVAEMVDRFRPRVIVETGTFRGTTTEWLAAFKLPIYTIESNEESFGFAQARLATINNITALHGDSRERLEQLLTGPLAEFGDANALVYLDAHWNDDLPLAEELALVFEALPGAVVIVDDFQVPDDPGYRYDDYGPGKALIPSYIEPAVDRYGLHAYFPSIPSGEETGAKRGCIVLIRGERHKAAVAQIAGLRSADGVRLGAWLEVTWFLTSGLSFCPVG